MQPTENLSLASFLSGSPKGAPAEAAFRGACGRAYYAAFGVARDALIPHFAMKHDGSDHQRVVTLMKSSRDVDIRTAAGLLDQLRKDRNSADYEVGVVPARRGPFDKTKSQAAVALAQGVINDISRVGGQNSRLQIP